MARNAASVSRQDAKTRKDRKEETPPATRHALVQPSMSNLLFDRTALINGRGDWFDEKLVRQVKQKCTTTFKKGWLGETFRHRVVETGDVKLSQAGQRI